MKIRKIAGALLTVALISASLRSYAQSVTYKVAEVTVSQARAYIVYSDGTKDEIPKVASEAQVIAKFLNEGWELKCIFYTTTMPTMIFAKTEK